MTGGALYVTEGDLYVAEGALYVTEGDVYVTEGDLYVADTAHISFVPCGLCAAGVRVRSSDRESE